MKFQRPCFKAHYEVEILKPDKVFLFESRGNHMLLQGHSYVLLATCLKKKLPFNDLIESLQKKLSLAEIYYLLMRLENKNLIEEYRETSPPFLASLCHFLEVPREEGEARFHSMRYSLQSLGRVPAKALQTLLKKSSIPMGMPETFRIVVTDHYRYKELSEINKELLDKKIPWLLAKVKGNEAWIGPLFVPEKTGCYECLKTRLNITQIEEMSWEAKKKGYLHTPDIGLPTSEIALGHIANEFLKYTIQGHNKELEGKILSFDLFTSTWSTHTLTKRPQCSSCGNKKTTFPKPIILQSQKEQHINDSGYRIVSAKKTYENYRHLISPITGIVYEMDLIPKHPSVLVYQAGTTLAHGEFKDRPYLFKKARIASGGKGKTKEQSQASCLCEAIERYSGVYHGDEYYKTATYQQLKDDAIHPHHCLLISENQYKKRHENNQKCHHFHPIPDPFDEKQEVEWSPIWSLTEQRFKWIPTSFCYYNFEGKGKNFCKSDSNGCAAGNTKEEAILQGFFELIERDGVALWWYSRALRPGVNLASFNDPYIDQLKKYYATLHRELWVLDITSDLEIPTFAALSRQFDSEKEAIIFGFGAHFDPKIALSRALTEMNQSLVMDPKYLDSIHKNWLDHATIHSEPYLSPHPNLPSKKLQDYKRFDSGDYKEEILTCQKIVESKGMEMLVLDQTRPDIGLPVVRVAVPGLRHFWNRYAPGRLYDIPLKLKWIDQKLTEEKLNPIPMFL